jgi:hypothetical protein
MIFQKIMKNHPNIKNSEEYERLIHQILYGSFRYCFYKDISVWSELMGNSDESREILNNFSGKYDSYFMEDFKWTSQNYDDMVKNSSIIKNWWDNTSELRNYGVELELESVSEFIENNKIDLSSSKEKINESVFESIYNKYIKRIFLNPIQEFNQKSNLSNAFIRYMIGQSRIFFTYNNLEFSQKYFKMISGAIKHSIDLNTINNCRNLFNAYIVKLCEMRYLTLDDIHTYEQVYALFKPNYVDYDHNGKDVTLDKFVETIL